MHLSWSQRPSFKKGRRPIYKLYSSIALKNQKYKPEI